LQNFRLRNQGSDAKKQVNWLENTWETSQTVNHCGKALKQYSINLLSKCPKKQVNSWTLCWLLWAENWSIKKDCVIDNKVYNSVGIWHSYNENFMTLLILDKILQSF